MYAKCWGVLGRGFSESGAFYDGSSIKSRLLNSFRLVFSYLHLYQCVRYICRRTDNMVLMCLYVIRGGLKDEFVHNEERSKVFNIFYSCFYLRNSLFYQLC